MAIRRRVSRTTRKAPVRRRRMSAGKVSAASIKAASMNAINGAIGGAAAALLTNVVGDNLGSFKPYTGLVGAVATQVFFKQPVIAAGMAGYAGAKVAADLTGFSLLAESGSSGAYVSPSSSMYLQGYEFPGVLGDSGVYASDYANFPGVF